MSDDIHTIQVKADSFTPMEEWLTANYGQRMTGSAYWCEFWAGPGTYNVYFGDANAAMHFKLVFA